METKEILNTLNNLKDDIERLSADERNAVSEALKVMSLYERKEEVETDFQGWEMPHYTMKDLRKFMKGHKNLDGDCKILILQDDGMGYGANNGYCTELSTAENKEGETEVHIWF
jgi:hypothetical protein